MKAVIIIVALLGFSAVAYGQGTCSLMQKAGDGKAVWAVTENVAKDGACIGFTNGAVPAENKLTIKNCAAGLYCSGESMGTDGTCKTAAKHGDDCSTGNTNCQQGEDRTVKLSCNSGKCQYQSTVGDGCIDDNDCVGPSGTTLKSKCTSSVCTGTVAADGACDNSDATKACKQGLWCASGKCKALVALDATCVSTSDMCVPGAICSGASGAQKCVLLGSQAAGVETGSSMACMQAYDSTTKKCVADRPGATVATGGECTSNNDCKSSADACGNCAGGGKGKCRASLTTGIYDTDTASYNKCMATSGCNVGSDQFSSQSCVFKKCGKSRAACGQLQIISDLNGGADNQAMLDMMLKGRTECTSGATTTTVSVMALLGAVAVALRLA